jgi:hypothetical protein
MSVNKVLRKKLGSMKEKVSEQFRIVLHIKELCKIYRLQSTVNSTQKLHMPGRQWQPENFS